MSGESNKILKFKLKRNSTDNIESPYISASHPGTFVKRERREEMACLFKITCIYKND